jgi:sulfate adenylyltransferase large subunit
MRDLKLIIVGHVDHGKSTFIGRLLYDTNSLPIEKINDVKNYCAAQGKEMEFAYLLDALQEEQEQNITIDLAYIYFTTLKRRYAIIDAPGHREFIKNMITGASQAEAAILIVDAQEGIQEQTRRHAYILSLLGISQVMVIMNKIDLINYDQNTFQEVEIQVRSFLHNLGISPSFVIPVSARHGENIARRSHQMPWYTGPTVVDALDTLHGAKDLSTSPLRFSVQDVYKIDTKRIIVGRIEAGTITEGQTITVLPTGEKTTVARIEEFLNENKKVATAGECTGITTSDPLFIERGYVLCTTEPQMTNIVRGNLFWMAKKTLQKSDRIVFKCATQAKAARIQRINKRIDSSTLEVLEENAEMLQNREVGEVIFEFNDEIIIDDFHKTPELGRFVIERDDEIVGGGIITS